jgi:tetratricopeptide (TPR) repeat protein
VGFRIRKSIQIVPGVRMTFSKSGIGYSAGVKGYRVTKRADGRLQRTMSLPGTGLSYVTTSGSARRGTRTTMQRYAPTTVPMRRPRKPGWFAPKGVKALYKAVTAQDVAAIQQVRTEHPEMAVAAAALLGVLRAKQQDNAGAIEALEFVFDTGKDPAADPFIATYVSASMVLPIAEGIGAELALDRSAVGLLLAELYQEADELPKAIDVVEQLEPTTYTALSLAELYCDIDDWPEVVQVTEGVTNEDDATAMLCIYRGIAFREQGLYEAARQSFKEALRTKKRDPVVRHRALLERARTHEREGKRAMARKDLERIMAEDSHYEGLDQALAELY